jgi:hypothetical protein
MAAAPFRALPAMPLEPPTRYLSPTSGAPSDLRLAMIAVSVLAVLLIIFAAEMWWISEA